MSVSLTGESAEELASRLQPAWTATAKATKAAAAAAAAATSAAAPVISTGTGAGFTAPKLPQPKYTEAQKMWPGLVSSPQRLAPCFIV